MATFTTAYHHKSYPAIDPTAPQNSMKGRSVLITGSTSGIGLAAAHAYLKACPSHIIIHGRRDEALSAAEAELHKSRPANCPTEISTKNCDLRDPAQVEQLWAELKSSGIPIDILILNAGPTTLDNISHLREMAPSFDFQVTANLRMADAFLAQGPSTGKAIVYVSSMEAHAHPPATNLAAAAYSASKAAGAAAFQAAADCRPVNECQIINLHPAAVLTDAVRRNGYDENSIVWDDVSLPASFFVWASTSQAAFLHGRFVWGNWDVDELAAMKPRFETDPGFLRIGLQGIPPVSIAEALATIAGRQQGAAEKAVSAR